MGKLPDDYIYSVYIKYTVPLVYNISPDYKSAYIYSVLIIHINTRSWVPVDH